MDKGLRARMEAIAAARLIAAAEAVAAMVGGDAVSAIAVAKSAPAAVRNLRMVEATADMLESIAAGSGEDATQAAQNPRSGADAADAGDSSSGDAESVTGDSGAAGEIVEHDGEVVEHDGEIVEEAAAPKPGGRRRGRPSAS